jgi:hypothetical protein
MRELQRHLRRDVKSEQRKSVVLAADAREAPCDTSLLRNQYMRLYSDVVRYAEEYDAALPA